jgi:DNA-binding transcriptional LysR family regulator
VFELYQLRYFAAVVDTGSFTRASQRVRVSQPTLSAGIRKLEEVVGAALLERTSRRVALTGEGARFLVHTRRILAEAEAALAEAAEARPERALSLGVLITVPAEVVARVVRAFGAREPSVALKLVDGTERELAARLSSGRLDAALTLERSEHRARTEPLYEEGYAVALAAQHPLASQPSVEVEALSDAPTIVRTRCEALASVSRFFTGHGLRPKIAYRTEQDERALALVGAGIGITVMPAGYRSPEVALRPLEGFDERRRIGVVFPSARDKRRADSPAARLCEAAQRALAG